jgi:hypothetical protein
LRTDGARFDAACFVIRAMAAGHSASQAEALAARCPGWQQAPSAAIDVFALASARLYDEIARNDPQPFKQCLASVTGVWSATALMQASSRPPVRLACPHPTACPGDRVSSVAPIETFTATGELNLPRGGHAKLPGGGQRDYFA